MATATDNCSDVSIDFTDEGSDIDCSDGGVFIRTFIAIDACDNQPTCTQIISVTPQVTAPDCSTFSVVASDDISICSGSTAQLSATGGIAYTWTPAVGLDDPFSPTPAASPTSTTTYTVTAIDQNGCEAQDQVRVSVNNTCLLYTSPSPRDLSTSRMPSSA